VTDLKVHRGDLVLSTQGRSFWILDDLGPLRELAARPTVAPVRLFAPRPAARGTIGVPLQEVDFTLPDDLPFGALLHYSVDSLTAPLALEVRDGTGATVQEWSSDSARAASRGTARLRTTRGLHRVVWELRGPGPQGGGRGVKLPPGRYRVVLTHGAASQEVPLTVTGNPSAPAITQADYDAQYALSIAVRDTLSALTALVGRARSARTQAQALSARIPASAGGVRAVLDTLVRAASALDDELTRPGGMQAQYQTLYGTLVGDGGYGSGSAEGRPSAARLSRAAELAPQWSAASTRLSDRLAAAIRAVNAAATDAGVGGIVITPRP
nr:hypothetical protein [Gemmatimonadaceae bacterium]